MAIKKLTVKQKKFADEYIKTGNATESAIKAGYSKKTARFIGAENLTKPNIKNYVEKQMKKLEDKKIAKAEEVLQYLTNVLRGEVEETITTFVEGFPVTTTAPPKISDRTKAAELLGKRYALFTDKTEVSGSLDVNNPFANLTTEELKKLAKGGK